ncbi:hypothetical protein D9M71_833570 [compost metagenome]
MEEQNVDQQLSVSARVDEDTAEATDEVLTFDMSIENIRIITSLTSFVGFLCISNSG